MFDIHRVEIEWGGRTLKLETGHMARQADAAVYAQYGETSVLATVVGAKSPKPGIDFFPLTVNYQERTYAAGKIPGGYFKREGRPTEKETLTSRLIDRPIRPLFVEGFKNEVQVVVTVLSHDLENDPDIVGMVAASAALTLSGLPFLGPIAAARVGVIGGECVLNPMIDEMAESDLDLVIAGTQDAVMMVESEAKELSEEKMLEAVMFGHKHFQSVIQAIIKLAEKAAKEPWDIQIPDKTKYKDQVTALAGDVLKTAFSTKEKGKRQDLVQEAKKKVLEGISLPEGDLAEKVLLSDAFKALEMDIMRGDVLKTKRRIDGRDLETVRPILSEVHVLPRTHGSALFTRGETQALVVATLGTGEDEQYVDALEGTRKERFLLHYNFPPYSVGETGRMGSPGRREIGHGKLAWRAVRPLLPKNDEFPYTLRVVSEITESNGSSSMATVCGTSLALMDAGVPLKAPVAGIAMGLISDVVDGETRYAALTDILGAEPHTEVKEYDVDISVERDEILATRCRFFQPMASTASSGGADVDYIYRVPHPFCSVLYKSSPVDENRLDVIAIFVQPIDEENVRAHMMLCVLDEDNEDKIIKRFQQTIFGQDKPILENQYPKRLPLDPRAETPIRADKSSIAYRRWLRDKGLTYGVIPAAA